MGTASDTDPGSITSEPYLTLNSQGGCRGRGRTEPVAWTVDAILLVESVVGTMTHVEHGRWPLRPGAA